MTRHEVLGRCLLLPARGIVHAREAAMLCVSAGAATSCHGAVQTHAQGHVCPAMNAKRVTTHAQGTFKPLVKKPVYGQHQASHTASHCINHASSFTRFSRMHVPKHAMFCSSVLLFGHVCVYLGASHQLAAHEGVPRRHTCHSFAPSWPMLAS